MIEFGGVIRKIGPRWVVVDSYWGEDLTPYPIRIPRRFFPSGRAFRVGRGFHCKGGGTRGMQPRLKVRLLKPAPLTPAKRERVNAIVDVLLDHVNTPG